MVDNIIIDPKTNVASFDVDCQYCFTPECPDELPVPGGTEIVPELNRQAQLASLRVGSKDAHSPHAQWLAKDESEHLMPIVGKENMDVKWKAHAIAGSKGFELIGGLPNVTEYDYFIWKGVELNMHPYGACYHDFAERMSTGVIEFLRSKGITTVLVGGLATDFCVKTTVLQLLKANFTVIVNLAACRGIDEETITKALQEMKQAGAQLIPNAAALKQ